MQFKVVLTTLFCLLLITVYFFNRILISLAPDYIALPYILPLTALALRQLIEDNKFIFSPLCLFILDSHSTKRAVLFSFDVFILLFSEARYLCYAGIHFCYERESRKGLVFVAKGTLGQTSY